MFRTVPLSIIRSFSLHTQQWYMSYRLDRVPSWSCSQAISKPQWHIPLLCVEWKTPDNGQRYCPKHAEFYSKNKFEKWVHLVGFIIRIYHDARSPERQICDAYIYCCAFKGGGYWPVSMWIPVLNEECIILSGLCILVCSHIYHVFLIQKTLACFAWSLY